MLLSATYTSHVFKFIFGFSTLFPIQLTVTHAIHNKDLEIDVIIPVDGVAWLF